jgi:hypothetical protein
LRRGFIPRTMSVRCVSRLPSRLAPLGSTCFNFVHWSIPFCGYKESGIGQGCGEAVLENYTETKAVYFNMDMTEPDAQ